MHLALLLLVNGVDVTDKKREYGQDFQLRGQAAVWRVASELAMRGHVPFFPGLDVGVDLVLENGLRLQIKSGSLAHRQKPGVKANIGYFFNLRRGCWDSSTKKYTGAKRRSYAEVADFFVLWGINESRFFIVPTNRKKTTIWFCARNTVNLSWNRSLMDRITQERVAEFEDRWDLLDVNSVKNLVDEPAQLLIDGTK